MMVHQMRTQEVLGVPDFADDGAQAVKKPTFGPLGAISDVDGQAGSEEAQLDGMDCKNQHASKKASPCLFCAACASFFGTWHFCANPLFFLLVVPHNCCLFFLPGSTHEI